MKTWLWMLPLPLLLLCVFAPGCRSCPGDAQRSSTPDADVAAKAPAQDVRFVAASRANVRQAPRADAERVGQLEIATRVTVLELGDGFARVRAEGVEGWVSESLLEKEAPTVEGLLQRFHATAPSDTAARRSLLERAAALSPQNLTVLAELADTLSAAGEEEAAKKARRAWTAVRHPVAWDGPIAGAHRGPAGACDSWRERADVARGLEGREDLVSLAPTPRPVKLALTCEEERPTVPDFGAPVVTKATLGDAQVVKLEAPVEAAMEVCTHTPVPLDPTCNGQVREDHAEDSAPGGCGYSCTVVPLENGTLQIFTRLEEDHVEATLDLWPVEAWLRFSRADADADAGAKGQWVRLSSEGASGAESEEPVLVLTGGDGGARVLLAGGDRCTDDHELRLVRWLADGKAEEGRRYRFDPGDWVSELCEQ